MANNFHHTKVSLTQNQYHGLKEDLPSGLPDGASYVCDDAG